MNYSSEWISVNDRLPDEDEWVLGSVSVDNCENDAPSVAVVKVCKGISKEDRAVLESQGDSRASIFKIGDEFGNNKVPYEWITRSPITYFGQDIVAWMPSPERYEPQEGADNGKKKM